MPPDVTSRRGARQEKAWESASRHRTSWPRRRIRAPSVFRPENLLREARRQRGLPDAAVPAVCALDPDGDIVRALRANGRSTRAAGWACYHTEMDVTEHAAIRSVSSAGGRRAIRRAGGGAVVRVRLPPADQRDLGRADRSGGPDAVLRADRPGAARRGDQPPLPAAVDVRRGGCGAGGSGLAGARRAAGAGASRHGVDHRCAVSRNRGCDRRGARTWCARGRDGGCGAVRVRAGTRARRAVLRARDQSDGRRRGRLREGRGGWRAAIRSTSSRRRRVPVVSRNRKGRRSC